MSEGTSSRFPTAVQGSVVWAAGAFIALGLFGFIPGITTDLASLEFAGAGSAAYMFGIFQVSILHNVVHLASGVVALLAAGQPRRSRVFLAAAGLFYMILAVYGWLLNRSTAPNLLPVNDADDWLHFGLALVLLVLAIGAPGLTSTERRARRGLV